MLLQHIMFHIKKSNTIRLEHLEIIVDNNFGSREDFPNHPLLLSAPNLHEIRLGGSSLDNYYRLHHLLA